MMIELTDVNGGPILVEPYGITLVYVDDNDVTQIVVTAGIRIGVKESVYEVKVLIEDFYG